LTIVIGLLYCSNSITDEGRRGKDVVVIVDVNTNNFCHDEVEEIIVEGADDDKKKK